MFFWLKSFKKYKYTVTVYIILAEFTVVAEVKFQEYLWTPHMAGHYTALVGIGRHQALALSGGHWALLGAKRHRAQEGTRGQSQTTAGTGGLHAFLPGSRYPNQAPALSDSGHQQAPPCSGQQQQWAARIPYQAPHTIGQQAPLTPPCSEQWETAGSRHHQAPSGTRHPYQAPPGTSGKWALGISTKHPFGAPPGIGHHWVPLNSWQWALV